MAGEGYWPVRSRRGDTRAERLRMRAAQGDARSDWRVRRRLLLLLRRPGSGRTGTTCRMEVLVRAHRTGPPPEVGHSRQLLDFQGLPRRAQPSLLPLEVDATVSRLR